MKSKASAQTLFIIGNGFDLYHGIPSSYAQFAEYLNDNDHETYNNANEYLHADDDDFWFNFEENLAHFDSEALLELASDSLVGYGAEKWSDAYHHDYQYEIEQVVSSLSIDLYNRFMEWTAHLTIPTPAKYMGKRLRIDKPAMFMSFNYTSTLTSLYGITEKDIFFIHGCVAANNIVLGHGWKNPSEEIKDEDYYHDTDPRVQQGDDIISSYFEKTFKPTKKIIKENKAYFKSLHDIQHIVILGHSLSDVDIPYFTEILSRINKDAVSWSVSFHEDVDPLKKQIEKIGIANTQVKYFKLDELIDY